MRKQVSKNETSLGTLARGLDVLGLFAEHGTEFSQTEISEGLGLPLPTVHRLTAVLAERGYLERDPRTRRFRLGLEVARLMPALLSGLRLPEVARPHLARLAADTGETVNLAVLHGGEVVYLLSESGGHLLTSQAPVGLRLPVHCSALGKCLLAQLPEELARAMAGPEPYERRTPATRTTWAALAPAVEEVRRTGVAVSEEEYEIGLVSLSVAVGWIDGPGSAAINVSLPSSRAAAPARKALVAGLRDAVRRIETGLAAAGIGTA
jgi:IclR family transcriptional regulator, acetate operon repressor